MTSIRSRGCFISSAALMFAAILPREASWARPPTGDARFHRVGAPARLREVLGLVAGSNAPDLVGRTRWADLVSTWSPVVERCTSHECFVDAVNAMFSAAGVSHFHYYTDEDWNYWMLRSTFAQKGRDASVAHIGVFPERIESRWFVRGILEGSAAAASEIRVGDELVSVEGEPYSPIAAFRHREGKPTKVLVCRRPGYYLEMRLTPVKESLYGALQRAMKRSIRVVERDGKKFAYLHGWTLLGSGDEYDRLGVLQDGVDGLLLDYRDGFGGTWHAAIRFALGERHEGGRAPPLWNKPIVVLTGDGTRSAKEIVVDALQSAERAILVGEPSAGAVVSVGSVRQVGADGLIMLPGQRFSLEGNPTIPDYFVPRDIRFSAGADAQLELAMDLLASLVDARAF